MAMIEVSDLAAPFRKWTHGVSIVLAIVLFIAFRLAGGGISLSRASGARSEPSSNDKLSAASFLDEDDGLSRSPAKTGASSSKSSSGFIERDDEFDPLSIPNSKKNGDEEEVVDAFSGAPADDGKKGGFADIERELGLR